MGFGNSGDTNRKKFTGYELDSDTGQAFAQARFYSGSTGRFTSPDPYDGSMATADPQSFNRYAYVRNNPVNSTDPTGLSPNLGTFMQYSDGREISASISSRAHQAWQDSRDPEGEWAARVKATLDRVRANQALQNGQADVARDIVKNNPALVAVGIDGEDLTEEFTSESGLAEPGAEPSGQEFCAPGGDGPYVLKKLPAGLGDRTETLKGSLGDGDCMQLPQKMFAGEGTELGPAGYGRMKRGEQVMGMGNKIKKGTLIASGFHPDGYYANYYPTGNHASIFLKFIPGGIRVLEQVHGVIQVVDKTAANGGYYSNPNTYYVVKIGLPIKDVPARQKYPGS